MASSLKFGTSGLRGLASELAGTEARRYAAAFVRHLRQTGWAGTQVLLGRDLRASSPAIARDVIAALARAGVMALDAGQVPTPALALAAISRKLPAIMVTGSHIPGDRNGLKFYSPHGEIGKAEEEGILAALGDAPEGRAAALAAPEVLAAYRARTDKLIQAEPLSNWRIGVWQHSSVGRDLLADIVARAGAQVVLLGRSEVFLAVDTEAVSAADATQIAAWVKAHRLDALVSADGDADRPLLADETGAVLRGDLLGILAAQFLGARTVVTPVTSNSAIETLFPNVVRTRVGSPFVIAGMAGAPPPVVGFEANGGLLLGSDVSIGDATLSALPTRDAVLPLLAVLLAARGKGQTLSQLAASLPPRHARSDRLKDVPEARSAALIELLRRDADGFLAEQGRIASRSDIDGLRFVLTSGDVIHYRPSGNAPELRCYTEASTPERADALLAWGLAAAEKIVR